MIYLVAARQTIIYFFFNVDSLSHFLRITNVGHVCSIDFILSHKGKAENFAKAVAHQNYISVNLTFKQPYYDDAEYNAETSEIVFD